MTMNTSAQFEQPADNNVSLKKTYNQWFDVIPAKTSALVDQVHRLRYQVYCIENSFEDPNIHPNCVERDEYDARSVHSLLKDRSSGAIAGTVRLILPAPKPEESFPIQGICKSPLLSDPKMFYHGKAAEISRFCISKGFRQLVRESEPSGASASDNPGPAIDKQLLMPCITIGLMKAIVQMSAAHGVTDWFAVMEPSLLRLLTRFGIYFKPIGPLVEYHGKRQPCYQNVEGLLARIKTERQDVWDVITDEGRLLEELRRKVNTPTRHQRVLTYRRALPLHA
ncbi:hypothetical protein ANRL4_00356 [Anaerolineae bacterium]|nr:hypothetical protein ANRL4_00356 [Anaerolineae bacterium]